MHSETLVLARGAFALADGQRSTVTLHLTAAGNRHLATTGHHPMRGEVVLTLAGGKTTMLPIVVR
jgi:hypothetical protein